MQVKGAAVSDVKELKGQSIEASTTTCAATGWCVQRVCVCVFGLRGGGVGWV